MYLTHNVPISRISTILIVLLWFIQFITARRFPDENYYTDILYDGEQNAKINAALQNLEHAPQWVSNWPNPSVKLGQVSGVAIDPAGRVLVFHRASNEWDERTFNSRNVYQGIGKAPIPEPTILVYNETGELIDTWGQNLFHMPHGITVDANSNVWVTDVALHQVFKFSPKNKNVPEMILGQKFEPGKDGEHFCKPTSVAVHSSGDFFVADGYCNSRIIKFSAAGNKILEWGKNSGPSDYVLAVPHALALAEERGDLCVADRERGRVACFDQATGHFRAKYSHWLIGPRLFSLAYSPLNGGRLYVVNGPRLMAEYPGSHLPVRGYVIDYSSGRMVRTFAPPDEFANPHDVAVAADGSVYVVELSPRTVHKFVDNTTDDTLKNVTHAKPTATVEIRGSPGLNVTSVGASGAWEEAWGSWGAWGAAALALAAAAALLVALARARHTGKTRTRYDDTHHSLIQH